MVEMKDMDLILKELYASNQVTAPCVEDFTYTCSARCGPTKIKRTMIERLLQPWKIMQRYKHDPMYMHGYTFDFSIEEGKPWWK